MINQLTGNNFNTFINEYRIKEACKRISDRDNYGNMTLEAIANSVGFKSVNSFRTAFKKVTGLFPSNISSWPTRRTGQPSSHRPADIRQTYRQRCFIESQLQDFLRS